MREQQALSRWRRLLALTYKEYLELSRDRSSILIGAVLPILLILLIGYGISLDIRNIPVAVVLKDTSPQAQEAVSFLDGSPYYAPRYVTSFVEAENLMRNREVEAILTVPSDFTAKLNYRESRLQLIVYGVNPTTASSAKGYIESGVQAFNRTLYAGHTRQGLVTVEGRTWFNDANSSAWYFVPGLIMLITTLVGVLLTSLVMAREWERGTMEAMFVTPVGIVELLIAKMIPYFSVAMLGFCLCLLAARFLFGVPLHGSFLLLLLSTILYLFVALGIGLLISSLTKSQFLSCHIALLIGFLPSLMLSGFIFDLHSVPDWVANLGQILPPTYYLDLLKTLFLTGNNWPLIGKNCSILLLYGLFFLSITLKITHKRVA